MNLAEEIEKLKNDGYSDINAQARLCQDIILQGIANSSLSNNITIKGGVVMRNLSNSARRATQDVDIDFIRYSLDDDSINRFVSKIDNFPNITIVRTGEIEELKHQDYKGKRIYILVTDEFGNRISSKLDIGVHADLELKQAEYCFDICFSEDGASLLMNTPAQMITEKLKSLLRFGAQSTRYKDLFDIYYLLDMADVVVLNSCIKKYIYNDNTLAVNNSKDILNRLNNISANKTFLSRLKNSKNNWIEIDIEDLIKETIEFFTSVLM